MEDLLSLDQDMEFSSFAEKVLFVVVLYKQRLHKCAAFESLQFLKKRCRSSISIFVYDNSPQPHVDIPTNIQYTHNSNNPGVSRAYNCAFEYAALHGFKYLFLLDQDTSISENSFISYSQSVAKYPDVHVFAPVAKGDKKYFSPFRLVRGRGTALADFGSGIYSLEKIKVINSGLLVSVFAFEKTGGYDESFPLDFSDIVFCDRLEKNHFELCLTEAEIQHRHSSQSHASANDRMLRFKMYLEALIRYKRHTDQKISYLLSGFPRALRLSGQHFDIGFVLTFFRQRQ
jgi:GT2 family glycosyltransferase